MGKQPNRFEYHVAWISPVSDLELLPSRLMFDDEHDPPPYDTHYDDNVYYCGTIHGHNVAMATCPKGMTGNVNAGRIAGPLFKTFPNIRMAVVVGIGGGVPRRETPDDPDSDVHLGDVVVGWTGDGKPACIYYDSGKWHTDGTFEMVGTIRQPDQILLNALNKLESDDEMGRNIILQSAKKLSQSLHAGKFVRPESSQDLLFQSTYRHPLGKPALGCIECDITKLVERPKRPEADNTDRMIWHRGRIATGNSVVRDGKRRDQINEQCGGDVLCIEMEAAGVDANRRCLVIRGISDYADSHKNDIWRPYAAGRAAIFARELLSKVPAGRISGIGQVQDHTRHFMVPFSRNTAFVGREEILRNILEKITPQNPRDSCQRIAIEGLGGVGKTQLALEVAYQLRDKHSVFWVPAINVTMFENSYRQIGILLGVEGLDAENADMRVMVKAALEKCSIGKWVLIIDNADDTKLFFDGQWPHRLADYLPVANGSILFTTRNRGIVRKLDIPPRNAITAMEMTSQEAKQLLLNGLAPEQLSDTESIDSLLDFLAYLPLAVKQASAYMAETGKTPEKYLQDCNKSDNKFIKLLSQDFEDQHRYSGCDPLGPEAEYKDGRQDTQNPVATTWLISFEHILRDSPLAAEYFKFICFLAERNIPGSLLQNNSEKTRGADDQETSDDDIGEPSDDTEILYEKAMGVLKGYTFVTERAGSDYFDVHRLVRLAMRNWIRQNGKWKEWVGNGITRLSSKFPFPEPQNRKLWAAYLPHTKTAIQYKYEGLNTKATCLLLCNIAFSYNELGKYEEAERKLRDVAELSGQMLGAKHPMTIYSIDGLGLALGKQAKFSEAERMHRQSVALSKYVLGREDERTLHSMDNLGVVLRYQGKFQEAENVHREALELKIKVLGIEHPETVNSREGLGIILISQRKCKEAEAVFRETLKLRKKILDQGHPNIIFSMGNLAITLCNQGKYNEAEKIWRDTLKLCEETLGHEHPNTLTTIHNLGWTLADQGKYEEAEIIHRGALELSETILGHKHADTLKRRGDIARIQKMRGETTIRS